MKSPTKNYILLLIFFLISSLIGYYITQRPFAPNVIANKIAENLREELEQINEHATELLKEGKTKPLTMLPQHEHFSFYIIEGNRVVSWSDNKFIPSPAFFTDTLSIKLIKSGGSDYLAHKWDMGKQRTLVAVIPLFVKYTITNDYLKASWNSRIFPPGNIGILEPNATVGIPVCLDYSCPFKISFVSEDVVIHAGANVVTLLFAALFVVTLLLFAFHIIQKIKHPDIAFVILLGVLWLLRILMTTTGFPAVLWPGDLFNPKIFAASTLNASLGDLLLNEVAIIILCIYIFRNLFHFRIIKSLQSNRISLWVLSVVAGVCVLFAMLFPFVVIQTLYNNSSIVLDLAVSLRFDALRIVAVITIILAGICSFLFSHAFIRIVIGDGNKTRIAVSFFISACLFSGFNYLTNQEYFSSLLLGSLFFIVVYGLKLYGSLKRLSFTTFTYLFVTILFISANSAFSIQHFSREDRIDSQFRFARNFLIDRDYFGEYLLRELSTKVSNDIFIQTRINNPFLNKDAVRQKIRQVFLSNYFNKYDVEIFIFNSSGEHSDNRSTITLNELLTAYNQDAYRTDYEGVFFISSPAADVTQKYLVVVPLHKMKTLSGHIVIELSLKKVIPDNVYPELLVDNRFLQFYRAQEISYGVFVNNKLSYSSGSFNYENLFNKAWFGYPALHTEGISKAGYNHIAQEDDLGRIAVVSSRSTSLTHILSNFSFLLVLGLITILGFIFFQGISNYWKGDKLYFSARIQLFLNIAFFLPLIIVSIMTLRVTNQSSQNQINEEYLNKTKKFSERIAAELNNRGAINFYEGVTFENRLTELAQLSSLDANVYNARGILRATSQPLIFENNLFSNYVNSTALNKIRKGANLFIEEERVGNLDYYTAYATLKTPATGELTGILAIPFFQSVYSLEKIQINILANILNIFSLIFIVLVALSYIVTKWLTFPLRFITQSLRKTSLTKVNQPLVWKSDDEIGLMVKEYNQMLFKLSESKAELEQTQRERAWREIAQQVAHEIKNPLTPMKLTLQQLERSVETGNNIIEKTQKAITSLLIQVNTLDDIASSFSSFAKMPEPVMKRLDLISLLKRIVDLHSHSGNLLFEPVLREIIIKGDEQLLGRTFSNIILNAFQASIPGEIAMLKIDIHRDKGRVQIIFEDNGRGMEANIAERIFIPHFTTKKSGSGLGLAIAKQGIEQMKGKIWFETVPGRGTKFFIELPIQDEV